MNLGDNSKLIFEIMRSLEKTENIESQNHITSALNNIPNLVISDQMISFLDKQILSLFENLKVNSNQITDSYLSSNSFETSISFDTDQVKAKISNIIDDYGWDIVENYCTSDSFQNIYSNFEMIKNLDQEGPKGCIDITKEQLVGVREQHYEVMKKIIEVSNPVCPYKVELS
jgi:hypothetical protein